jgi:hypothetical protein
VLLLLLLGEGVWVLLHQFALQQQLPKWDPARWGHPHFCTLGHQQLLLLVLLLTAAAVVAAVLRKEDLVQQQQQQQERFQGCHHALCCFGQK